MQKIVRLLVCIATFNLCLYLYLNQHTRITELRYELPQLQEQLTVIKEKNATLSFKIDRFESSAHLAQLLEQPEFSYLQHPTTDSLLWINAD